MKLLKKAGLEAKICRPTTSTSRWRITCRGKRSFVKKHYADSDCSNCSTKIAAIQDQCIVCGAKKKDSAKRYLTFADGSRSPFPNRMPRTVRFAFDENNSNDPYAALYSDEVVRRINRLGLPRYGLGNYIHESPSNPPTAAEARIIADLSRDGQRMMGFCRTNLFKRLESSGDLTTSGFALITTKLRLLPKMPKATSNEGCYNEL